MTIYGYNPNPFLKASPTVLPRRKVFISYFKGDKWWVDKLVADWGQSGSGVFIPHVLGVREDDDFVDSDDVDYIMSAIRDRYLQDTSVTIVIIGRCTHSRRFVDWEIKGSLRQPANGLPNGLLGIEIPPPKDAAGNPIWHHLPDRFSRNYDGQSKSSSYARYYVWPTNGAELRRQIEEVFQLASTKANLIVNPQEIPSRNLMCKVHNEVHSV